MNKKVKVNTFLFHTIYRYSDNNSSITTTAQAPAAHAKLGESKPTIESKRKATGITK